MIRLIKRLAEILRELIKRDREKNELNGLYVDNEIPRALGTKIRRFY